MKLYKYTAVNENSLSILIHSHLWFADPRSLNDPFDVDLHTYYQTNYQNILKSHSEEIEKLYQQNKSIEEKINLQKFLITNMETFKFLIDEKKYYDAIGVLSLSKENGQSNTLMWSHYGDSHKGIALEFDTEKDSNFFKGEIPAFYMDGTNDEKEKEIKHRLKKNAPHLLQKTDELPLFIALLSKSEQWQYEKEVRLIKADIKDNQRLFEYLPQCLTGIYFGLNTTEEHKKMIQTIIQLKNLTKTVQFYQAEKVPNAFTLNYKKISIED